MKTSIRKLVTWNKRQYLYKAIIIQTYMTIECLLTNYNQVFQKAAEYNSKDILYFYVQYIYIYGIGMRNRSDSNHTVQNIPL